MSVSTLPTDFSQLKSANRGVARVNFQQISSTRDATGTNFPNGAIEYKFSTSGSRWWVPEETYLRIRVKLTDGAGNQLTTGHGIAPNLNMMNNLFQSAEFQINNKTVSRISDFMGQIGMVETRLGKSKAWRDGVGSSLSMLSPDLEQRIAEVSSDEKYIDEVKIDLLTVDHKQIGYEDVNAVEYDAGTTTITFEDNKGGGGTAGSSSTVGKWSIGDIITFTGTSVPAGSRNKPVRVIARTDQTLVVEAGMTDDFTAGSIVAGNRQFTKSVEIVSAKNVNTVRAWDGLKASEFELIWTPPLSIFKLGHPLPPNGNYSLILNPQPDSIYKSLAVETVATKTAGADFQFEIQSMFLYVKTIEGERVENLTYLLDLEPIRCISDKIISADMNQRQFDVPPSTYALTIAYQDEKASSDNTTFSASRFKVDNNLQNSLTRFYIQYAGLQLPQPDADPRHGGEVVQLQQRYAETMLNSGMWFDPISGESFKEWLDLGMLLHFAFPKDGTDHSTRCVVDQQFSDAGITAGRILLFAHYREVGIVKIENSRVVDVSVQLA
jgi:hypothetical protein